MARTRRGPQTQANAHVAGCTDRRRGYPTVGQSNRPSVRVADRPSELSRKKLKGDLAIRPIYHQTDERIEAHILVAFLAYCLQVTLKQRLRALAPGLTPRSVLDKMAAIQMVDVQLPTTDGRTVILSRYTEPERDQALLLQRLKINLPDQPPPRITTDGIPITQ
jgi:hypothetical protein